MNNYICINGNKTELTEEQLKQLGIELPKANPFERAKYRSKYYCIDPYGCVTNTTEANDQLDRKAFSVANYCTDKSIMEQRALHETLNRLLWRYSMEHKASKDEQKINGICIKYSGEYIGWHVYHCGYQYNISGVVYFDNERIAHNAIEEIVKPFLASPPEFKF